VEACSLRDRNLPYKVSFDFDNFTMRYSLYCENAHIRNDAKLMLLVMSTLICLCLLVFADVLGRKKLMKIASILVLAGIVVAAIMPDFRQRMFGLGMVSGGEGAFSALFTIYINENTTRQTKLRSSLVSISFLAYALGCVALNAIAYITMNPHYLMLFTAGFLCCSVAPAFWTYYETPYYLYKKGRISELFRTLMDIYKYNQGKHGVDDTLMISVENKLLEDLGFSTHITHKAFFKSSTILLEKRRSENYKSNSAVLQLCMDKRNLVHMLGLILIGGFQYCLFYGMSINIDSLGLKDIKLNGILLGVTQAIGYIAVIPFTHKMKRRAWSIVFQAALLTGAFILLLLSKTSQTPSVMFLQTIVSTFLMASVMSAQFPLFFIYITEAFPTEVRGTANALVLFSAKLIGSASPLLLRLSEELGVHVLVGCALVGTISFPLTFCLKETLGGND
jgi:MFS family permease